MSEQKIIQRAQGMCELCKSEQALSLYEVPDSPVSGYDSTLLLCGVCQSQLTAQIEIDPTHWRCLNEAMWSTTPAVQVVAWRILQRLNHETWAQDLLDMLYLDDTLSQWAHAGGNAADTTPTLDSNGAVLSSGDTVHLIKDLNVKGVSFTAKRGTAVRNISLSDNPEHIEGKVNGTRIVIIAAYTKKA